MFIKKHNTKALVWFLVFALVFAYSYVIVPPVQAGDATNFKDTLSDSRPSTVANHAITFVAESAVDEGDTITLTFDSGFTIGSVDYSDIDIDDDSNGLTLAADCAGPEQASASFSGSVLTFEICAADGGAMVAGSVVDIRIGLNTTTGDIGDQQLANPATLGVKNLDVAGTFGDTNRTKVVIVNGVTVTATIPTLMTFTITGMVGSACPITSAIDTTSTSVPFGTIDVETFYDACQKIKIGTNANDGYSVTVQETDQLTSGSDQITDGDCDGTCTDVVANEWSNVLNSVTGLANDGFGYCMDDIGVHDGASTADASWGTNGCSDVTPYFKTIADAGASEATQDIMSSSVKTTDRAYISFRLNVAPEQPGGDYSTTIVYIATPQFD